MVVVLAAGCDQTTKLGAVAGLTEGASDAASGPLAYAGHLLAVHHPRPLRRVDVVHGFWDFEYSENPGAAFSALRDIPPDAARAILLVAPLLALAILGRLIGRSRSRWAVIGASLILAGAFGNTLDRARLGYVVDFVHWHLRGLLDWPIFNLADVWVAIGAAMLLWIGFTTSRVPRHPQGKPPSNPRTPTPGGSGATRGGVGSSRGRPRPRALDACAWRATRR